MHSYSTHDLAHERIATLRREADEGRLARRLDARRPARPRIFARVSAVIRRSRRPAPTIATRVAD